MDITLHKNAEGAILFLFTGICHQKSSEFQVYGAAGRMILNEHYPRIGQVKGAFYFLLICGEVNEYPSKRKWYI